jgi:hypothetical protein
VRIVSESGTYRVRRALSHSELTTVLDSVHAAGSTKEILAAVVQGVFGALLRTVEESLADYGPDRKLDADAFAIPATQWAAIADACHARADAFGTRTDIALTLADLMPVSYDDPTVTVALRPTIDHRPHEHVLTVSREATDAITAASKRCDQLGTYFGVNSPQHLNAVRTWQHGICTVFSMIFGAATTITHDGPMSLLINSSSGYVYALVFHPDLRVCANPGCGVVIDDDGNPHPPDTGAPPPCPGGRHRPPYPLDAPHPGTWQLHS